MLKTTQVRPLGTVLRQAGLVSETQIEIALDEQSQNTQMRIGRILALHGWIKSETADFFAQQWPTVLQQKTKQPMGQYFKQAALLDEEQIETILEEQKRTRRKFGELAVLKGWISPKTLDFFLRSLLSQPKPELTPETIVTNWRSDESSPNWQKLRDRLVNNKNCNPYWLLKVYGQILQRGQIPIDHSREQAELIDLGLVVKEGNYLKIAGQVYQSVFSLSWVEQELTRLQPYKEIRLKLLKLEGKASSPDLLLEQVLSWTNGQPFLTQKLCQLISDSVTYIPSGEEAGQVEKIVKTRLVDNSQSSTLTRHIQKLRDHLLEKDQKTGNLLRLYGQIVNNEVIVMTGNPMQQELLSTGLVVEQHHQLKVANPIYQLIFNQEWVEQELKRLRPYETLKLKLEEKADSPYEVLAKILTWTNRQPVLTRILCELVCNSPDYIRQGQEAQQINHLVQKRIIDDWEKGAAADYLGSVRDRLLEKDGGTGRLLGLYGQILQQGVPVSFSREQHELVNLGLVQARHDHLVVDNLIYAQVFNLDWVGKTLAEQRVSSKTLKQAKADSTPKRAQASFRLKRILLLLIGANLFLLLCLLAFNWISRRSEVRSIFALGNELFSQGEYELAIANYDEVLQIDGEYYQAWTNRGYALGGLQNYSKMLESCQAATIIEPEAVYAWNCQGEALYNLEQYQLALEAFEQALSTKSAEPIFYVNKAETLTKLGQPEQALENLNLALALLAQPTASSQEAQELAIALSSKGRILRSQQQYQEALEVYDQALEYAPEYFVARRDRGLVLKALGRDQQATNEFNKILNQTGLSDAQRAETWFYQGLTLCSLSQPKAGIAAFNQALELKPDYQAAQQAKQNCS